jgi:hypothetical protein
MSDISALPDPLTPGQRTVHDLIRTTAPAALLGGSAAMAERGLLGPPDGLRRRLGGLDFYVPAGRHDNQWSLDPWPVMQPAWQGPQPEDLPALPQIEQALSGAGLEVTSVGESRRPLAQRSDGVRLEVRVGDERVPVVFRPVRRELAEHERDTGMLDRDELAMEKVHAALDPERSTPTHLLDMATMFTVMGEEGFEERVGQLHEEYGWRYEPSDFAAAVLGQFTRHFQAGFNETRDELSSVISDHIRADADLQDLLGHAAETLDPERAERYLRRRLARGVQGDIHEALGVESGQVERSIESRLRAVVGRGDRGAEL